MFEKSVETFWFGNTPQLLAKRATTSATDPLEKVPHIFRGTLFLDGPPAIIETAPVADPELVILEKCQLRMYGARPLTDATLAREMLTKLTEADTLTKLSQRPGSVSLTPADGGALEKRVTHQARLSAVADYLLRRFNEGLANGDSEAETFEKLVQHAREAGDEETAQLFFKAAQELISLEKAA